MHEALALLELPEPPQRAEHVVAVAQPAVAVVPGASAARRLGDRGRRRGHDRAGVLEAVQLERERRADDLGLALRRDVALLDPALPVAQRLAQEALAERGQRLLDRLAPGQHEVLRRRQREGPPAEVRERDVGGQAQPALVTGVVDVVAALHALGQPSRPAEHRLAEHPRARRAGHRLEHAHEHRRPEVAAVLLEARREVEHAELAVGRLVDGLEHVAVRQVAETRARGRRALRAGGGHAEAAARFRVEQCRKYRLGVEPGQAAPDHVARVGHERRELAIADQSQLLEADGCWHADCSLAIGVPNNSPRDPA